MAEQRQGTYIGDSAIGGSVPDSLKGLPLGVLLGGLLPALKKANQANQFNIGNQSDYAKVSTQYMSGNYPHAMFTLDMHSATGLILKPKLKFNGDNSRLIWPSGKETPLYKTTFLGRTGRDSNIDLFLYTYLQNELLEVGTDPAGNPQNSLGLWMAVLVPNARNLRFVNLIQTNDVVKYDDGNDKKSSDNTGEDFVVDLNQEYPGLIKRKYTPNPNPWSEFDIDPTTNPPGQLTFTDTTVGNSPIAGVNPDWVFGTVDFPGKVSSGKYQVGVGQPHPTIETVDKDLHTWIYCNDDRGALQLLCVLNWGSRTTIKYTKTGDIFGHGGIKNGEGGKVDSTEVTPLHDPAISTTLPKELIPGNLLISQFVFAVKAMTGPSALKTDYMNPF